MENTPLVTVVTSVYNAGAELRPSLENILSQKGVEIELIVVNDGSTDDSADILADIARNDSRIRILTQENRGLTVALIQGCKEAQGEYIARQDIGDRSLPDRLHKQVELINSNPDIVMVTCGYRFVGPKDEILGEHMPRHTSEEWTEILLNGEEKQLYGPHHGSVVFRKGTYEAVGGYRPEFYFAQDLDLWTRMAVVGKLDYVPEVLYQVGFGYDSISARFGEQQRRLRSLIGLAAQRRLHGESEADLLQQAAAIHKPSRLEELGDLHIVEADYFIGSCLVARHDPAARRYLRRVLQHRPFHGKAWAKLLRSYSGGLLPAR